TRCLTTTPSTSPPAAGSTRDERAAPRSQPGRARAAPDRLLPRPAADSRRRGERRRGRLGRRRRRRRARARRPAARARPPPAPPPRRVATAHEEPLVSAPLVEILYFDGCPNHKPAVALVERLSRELGIEPELRLVNVADQEAARRLRFLGSPTIRIGGVDVDPRTEERDDYALSCRIFRTDNGVVGQPDERWVREALLREAGVAS